MLSLSIYTHVHTIHAQTPLEKMLAEIKQEFPWLRHIYTHGHIHHMLRATKNSAYKKITSRHTKNYIQAYKKIAYRRHRCDGSNIRARIDVYRVTRHPTGIFRARIHASMCAKNSI
jgi:hypothetical protein